MKKKISGILVNVWNGWGLFGIPSKVCFLFPKVKIDKVLGNIRDVLFSPKITPRILASIAGNIIALQPSLGNICSIMIRVVHMIIANSMSWDHSIYLTDEVVNDPNFWLFNLNSLPSKCFIKEHFVPERIIYTDASKHAAAGFIGEIVNSIVHKMWNSEEASKSSTWREMKAVDIALLSSSDKISNKTDN